jgi:phage recombination protein Bet
MSAIQEVIPAGTVQAQRKERTSLIAKVASRFNVDPTKMMDALKQTAFRLRDGEVTDAQMMALLVVADQYGLNPWTKEIYAFPDKNGAVVPVVGIDGWSRIINEHPQFDGMEFAESTTVVTMEGAKPCPEWIECVMYRKDRSHAVKVREYLDEVYRPPFKNKFGTEVVGPWQTHTKRFLRHKTVIQCARLAFAFVGIYDEDEAARIVAAEDAIDITPPKEGHLSPVKLRKVVDGMTEAVKAENGVELHRIWKELTSDQQQFVWSQLRSWERTAIKKLLDATKNQAPEDIDPWAIEAIKASNAETWGQTWRLIQDAYTERDREVPADVETFAQDRKAELGVTE